VTATSLFVPGRLCLFGEHSDWAGAYRSTNSSVLPGCCLAVGTTQGIHARIEPSPVRLTVDSHGLDGVVDALQVDASVGALRAAAQSGSFYAYCAGVAAHMVSRFRVGGITIQTSHMDLPIKKGLSSSAAISVLTARAYNQVYGLGLNLRDEMECAYLGEIMTGSECGRMDQVCAYGPIPVFLTFDGERMDVESLSPQDALHLVIIDLQRCKDTRKILHQLNAAFTSDSSIGSQVRDALGTQNTRILHEARTAINDGSAACVGELMSKAQSIFDHQVAPACPSELIAPKLHEVLNHPLVNELSWGGKGVGSQGDGSAQLIARNAEAQHELIQRLPRLLDVHCLELTIAPKVVHPR
jgi:galactokinase